MHQDFERQQDAKQARRMHAQDRYLTRLEKLEAKAAPMVGELCSGKFYCYPVGGTYFEAASRTEVMGFLIRNKYVA